MLIIPTDRGWNRKAFVFILPGCKGIESYRTVSLIVEYWHHNPSLFHWEREL